MSFFNRKDRAHASPREAAGIEATELPTVSTTKQLGGKLARLSLPQQVAVLAVWPLAEQVLNLLVGLVDMWVAGHLPDEQRLTATNGIAVGGYIEWLMHLIQGALGIGAAALISRAIGGKHRRLAHAALGQAVLAAVALGLFMGAVTYFAAPAIAEFAALTDESLRACVTYIRVLAFAAPLSAVLMVCNASLRAAGDTRTPFVVMVVVNIVNAFMSVLLTSGPAPLGNHGVQGIALGTVIGWFAGTSLVLISLLRNWGGLRLHLHRLRPHTHTLQRIVRVGLPSLLESTGHWFGNFLVIKIVGHVGQMGFPGAPGAHMIAVRVEAISFLPGMALGVAASTLVGQYLGLGDPARARQAANLCWGAGVALMTFMGLVLIVFADQFVAILTSEPQLQKLAPPLLRTAGCIQAFFACYMVLSQALRGAGDTRTTMWLTYASTFLIRLPGAYMFGIVLGWGLWGVWLALCTELTVRGCLFTARYLHGGWMRVKV